MLFSLARTLLQQSRCAFLWKVSKRKRFLQNRIVVDHCSRDLGFVRFGWRDYDTFTSRWTAPDPIGDKGGDPDWYGYCLDDPVNGVDAGGLNPALAWTQYIPAVNTLGKWIAEDVMTGGPGVIDALEKGVKKLPEAGKWYIDTVDSNIRKQQEARKKSK